MSLLHVSVSAHVDTSDLDLRTRGGREAEVLRLIDAYPEGMRMWDILDPPARGAALWRLVKRGDVVNLTHEVAFPNMRFRRAEAFG